MQLQGQGLIHMPSYLQVENISESYGPKILFEHITFNINEGDKIALVAPNGTGKTSLLLILHSLHLIHTGNCRNALHRCLEFIGGMNGEIYDTGHYLLTRA